MIAGYLVAVVGLLVYFNVPLTIEWVVLILCLAAVLTGRGALFLRDWGAFILVLFAWQITAPVATQLPFPWHLTEMISADRLLFGGVVPAQWLQQRLYSPNRLAPWDVFAAVMYMLHFVTPLIAGFVLWLKNRGLFHRYALAFTVIAVAGYITWIVYPAVPPWMAAEHLRQVGNIYQRSAGGQVYLPGVKNLFNTFVWNWYNSYNGQITIGFLHGHVDQVGAIPSEHAAFPFLIMLFLRRQFGRIAYLSLLYIAGVVFSVMYLGQHYFIDVLAGFAYALGGYALVMYALPVLLRRVEGYGLRRLLHAVTAHRRGEQA